MYAAATTSNPITPEDIENLRKALEPRIVFIAKNLEHLIGEIKGINPLAEVKVMPHLEDNMIIVIDRKMLEESLKKPFIYTGLA